MLTGEQLRMARAALRLTVKALADLAGVDKGTIVRIEAGEKSYRRTLKDLRETLEKLGLVFLDTQDGIHGPGVALGWNVAFDGKDEQQGDVTGNSIDDNLNSRAWDEDLEDSVEATELSDNERAWLNYVKTNPNLSERGREILLRTVMLSKVSEFCERQGNV